MRLRMLENRHETCGLPPLDMLLYSAALLALVAPFAAGYAQLFSHSHIRRRQRCGEPTAVSDNGKKKVRSAAIGDLERPGGNKALCL